MIAIVDYGAGNLRSVKKAFDFLGVESKIIRYPAELVNVNRVVLPGVGAFGAAVNRLRSSGFWPLLTEFIRQDRPFLGICLGMQLLLQGSEESPGVKGLAVFEGINRRFAAGKVPQIGWNQIRMKRESPLLAGIAGDAFFYFIHGYYIVPQDTAIVVAETDYYLTYGSIIQRGNLFAVQFHPEKSGDTGLQLLRNWVEKC